ncbi:heat shock 70 kDa protein 12A-like [Saccostrea cucullata]|uniref:heat shock 70 kDa protein 12A-like n=1 Tax=Saccostrea cuccullata TaxID=36930 RepID=UPI002ED67240
MNVICEPNRENIPVKFKPLPKEKVKWRVQTQLRENPEDSPHVYDEIQDVHDEIQDVHDEIQDTSRENSFLLVAAIDFGTTYSGYAYAMKSNSSNNSEPFNIPRWPGNGTISNRVPTAVLFGPDGSFLRFGYEANTYMQDNPNDEDLEKFYFFQDFKMLLYQTKDLSLNTQIPDITGRKTLPAIVVFSSVIQFFSNHLMSNVTHHFGSPFFEKEEIFWVLTVPAIWSLRAKCFMREAAEKAGIPTNQLSIALEPEAASVLCRQEGACVLSNDITGEGQKTPQPLPDNSTYLVVDMGGGTVDITLHHLLEGGIRELYKASGGDFGGNQINKRYLEFLEKLFGKDILEAVKQKHPSCWFDIITNFERKKRTFGEHNDQDRVVIGFPFLFVEEYKKLKDHDYQERINPLCYGEDVEIKNDKLYIKEKIFKSFFEGCLGKIKKCIETILEHGDNTDTILFVGGLAESPYLIRMLREHFSNSKVLVPKDPSLAVLKGAVWFGRYPAIIKSRICQYTYGFAKQRPFIDGKDDKTRRKTCFGNRYYIDDVFDKHVEIGEMLEVGKFQQPKDYHPLDNDQVVIILELYASTEKYPKYVNDPSCHLVGVMKLDVKQRNPGEDGTVSVRLNFSGTELEIEAREKRTGNVAREKVNFLG